jgi:hypothetical protein
MLPTVLLVTAIILIISLTIYYFGFYESPSNINSPTPLNASTAMATAHASVLAGTNPPGSSDPPVGNTGPVGQGWVRYRTGSTLTWFYFPSVASAPTFLPSSPASIAALNATIAAMKGGSAPPEAIMPSQNNPGPPSGGWAQVISSPGGQPMWFYFSSFY